MLGFGLLVALAFAAGPETPPAPAPGQPAAPPAEAAAQPQQPAASPELAPAVPHGVAETTLERRLRSYVVPAVEGLGVSGVIWGFDVLQGESFAQISGVSIADNFTSGWFYDDDDFQTNLILHPYQGSLYYTAARSSGLGFWVSSAYAVGGSLIWEYIFEVQQPSINDQITTSVGGIVLGEALFRIARLVLPWTSPGSVGRELGAAAIAPMAGANRLLLEGRPLAAEPFPQAWRGRLLLGAGTGRLSGTDADARIPWQARIGFELTNGLPTRVQLREPFDHFHASLDFASATLQPWNELEEPTGPWWSIAIRGLVAGGASRVGDEGRLLAGVFATMDYSGPTTFRAASTGVGPGIVLAVPGDTLSAEATLVAAGVFGSAGGKTPKVVDRDYRYAYGGLLIGDVRLGLVDRLELRAQARGYLVPRAVEGSGSENFVLANASVLVRIAGPHALSLEGWLTERHVRYADAAYHERALYGGVSYTLMLGGTGE